MTDDSTKKPEAPPSQTKHLTRRKKQPAVPPKMKHGTRVCFEIECKRCGTRDTLPFVPRTQGEILCKQCARKVFGPNWAGSREIEETTTHDFVCAKCGREATLPFKPELGQELLCEPCYLGIEIVDKKRLKKMKRVK